MLHSRSSPPDPPMAQYKCERLLEVYASIPADGDWDSIEWLQTPKQ